MLEIIKNISAVLTCFSVALALVLTISKTAREWISKLFVKQKAEEKKEDNVYAEDGHYDINAAIERMKKRL